MPGPDKNNSRKLYDALSEDYEMGSYEDFERDIQDDAKRRKLYDTVYEDYDLPDYDEFSRQLGVGGGGAGGAGGSSSSSSSGGSNGQTGNTGLNDTREKQAAAAERRRNGNFLNRTFSALRGLSGEIGDAVEKAAPDAAAAAASNVPAESDAQTQPTLETAGQGDVKTADSPKVTDSLRVDSSGALLPQGIQGKGMFDLSEYDNQSWLINGQQFNSTAEARKYVEEHPEIRYNFNADGKHFKSFDELVQYVKDKSKAAFDELEERDVALEHGSFDREREATQMVLKAMERFKQAIKSGNVSNIINLVTGDEIQNWNDYRRSRREEYDKLHFNDFVKSNMPVFFQEQDAAEKRARDEMIRYARNATISPNSEIDYGTNMQAISLRETDPQVISSNVVTALDRKGALTDYMLGRMGIHVNEVPEDYNPLGGGGSTLTGAEMNALTMLMHQEHSDMADKIQHEIYEYYKRKDAPDSDLEYILSSAVHDNLMATLQRAFVHRVANDSGIREQMREIAFGEYGDNAGFLTNVAATAAPFVVDMALGAFKLPGMAGEAATSAVFKGVAREGTKRLVARGATKAAAKEAAAGAAKRWIATEHPYWNMAVKALGSGVNFAAYEAQNELVRQYNDGQFSLGSLLGKGAKGFLLGGATGFAGGFFGKMGENMRGWQRLGVDVAGFGSEVTIFATSDAAMQAMEGEDVNWGKAFGRSLAMVTGFKAVGGVMNPKAVYQRYTGPNIDYKLTDADKSALSDRGYDFSTKEGLNKAIGELAPVVMDYSSDGKQGLVKADGAVKGKQPEVDRKNYDNLMGDDNLDVSTKRKVNYLMTGSPVIRWTGGDKIPFSAVVVENEDGTFTIQTYDVNGKVNGIAEYTNGKEAEKDYGETVDLCRFYNLNGIRAFLGNAGADVTIERDAFERTRKQFADEDVSELEALLSLKKPQEEWTDRDREILDAHLQNVHDVFGEQLKDYQAKQAAAAYDGAAQYEESMRAAQEQATRLLTGGTGAEGGGGVPPAEGGDGPVEQTPADKARADYERLMADVENRKRVAESGVREVFGDDVMDYLTKGEGAPGFDPIFLLRQALVSGESDENIAKITAYINAWYADKGVRDGVNGAFRSEVEQSDAEIDGAANRQSGHVLGAVMKVDDRRVFVVDGEVVLNDDGTIDREKSSESIIVKDAATGKVEVVDPRDVLEVVDGGDAAELKEAARKDIEAKAAGLPVPGDVDAADNGGQIEAGGADDAMPMIGEGEDAEPDFMQTSPERGFRYIYDESGWDQDEGDAFVEANLAEAKKQLNAATKKKPKMGTSMSKYNKEKRDYEGKVQAAQQVVDYWDGVKQARDQRAGEELRRRAEEEARRQDEERNRQEQARLEEQRRQEEEQRKQQEAEELGSHTVGKEIRDRWTGAPKVEGNADELTLADGTRIAGRYVLVESGAATPSHNAGSGFVKNTGFPVDENGGTVNDRDYERDTRAQAITREMGRTYDGRALQSVPVVSRDGVVLSGNGRTMAGEIAAADGTDGAYIENLSKYGGKFGFTPEQVAGMQHPRVVFVPDEALPYDAETFARFNAQEMKGQNKTETAVKLGKIVPDDVYNRVIRGINGFESISDFFSDDKATAEVVNELRGAGVINEMQYGEMFDGGRLSGTGRELIENVLIGKAFEGNPDAVRMLTEYPAMRQKAVSALTAIGNNRRLGGDYTLEHEIGQAIELAYRALKSGAYKHGDKVSDFARQQNLFEFDEGSTVADYQNMMVMLLADVMNGKEVNKLRNVLELYNAHAAESAAGQTDMFSGGAVRTKEEILNDVYNLLGYGTRKEIEQQRSGARETVRAQLDGASPGKPSGGNEGAEPSGTAGAVDTGGAVGPVGESGAEPAPVEAEPVEATEPVEAEPNAVQAALAAAEHETNTEPTEAQKEAGNYKKGHVKIDGYDVTIENPKGSIRRGTDASGKQWEQEMQNTYGYIRGTEGVDGDHIDVFFSEDPSQGDVFVVDQVNKDGSFDEHKVMYGFPDIESARKAYLSNYEDGWQGLGAITPVSKEEFKKWIDSSHRKTKPFAEYSSVKPLGDTQLGEQPTAGYSIEPTTYTNKKGKTTPMYLVTFGRELSKDEIRAGKELAKESRGWWDREKGGFLMRSEEAANEIGEKLGNAEAVKDAQPLGLKDVQAASVKGGSGKPVPGSEINGTETAPVAAADANKPQLPNYDYDLEDSVYDETLTGLRDALNNREPGSVPNIESIEREIRVLRKRAKNVEVGIPTASAETLPQAFEALANFNGRRKAYEQFLSDIRKRMKETERDEALSAHGVKLGDKVIYKGEEATIHDADHGHVTLDTGMSPVIYESVEWGNVELPKRDSTDHQPKRVNVEGLLGALKENGTAKLSDHTEDADKTQETGSTNAEGEEQPRQEKKKSKWVDDEDAERFEELRRRMREKLDELNRQRGAGVDPEMFAIGAEMAFYMIKHGLHKFADFAREMIEAVGDGIRPYLKSLYEGARNFPEMEDYLDKMTPYDDVRKFDVKNFDKEGAKDILGTAEQIVLEEQAAKETEAAVEKLTDRRNAERRDEENGVVRASDGTPLRKAVEADFDGERPVVYVDGEPKHVFMVQRSGEQTSGATFSAPVIDYIHTTDGKQHRLDEVMVEDDRAIRETVARYRNTIVDRMKTDPVVINTVKKNNETTYIPALSFMVKSDYLYGSLGDIDNPEYISFIKAIDNDVDGFIRGTVDAVVAAVRGNAGGIDMSKTRPMTYEQDVWGGNADTDKPTIVYYDGKLYELGQISTDGKVDVDGVERVKGSGYLNDMETGERLPEAVPLEELLVYDENISKKRVKKPLKSGKKSVTSQKEGEGSPAVTGAVQLDLFGNAAGGDEESDNNKTLNKEKKNGKNADIQTGSTSSGRGRYEQKPDGALGEGSGDASERPDRRGVDRRDASHPGSDSGRGGRLPGLSEGGERLDSEKPVLNSNNNHVERGVEHAPKTVDKRIEANIAAIELLQKIQSEDRKATPKEMEVLRKFSGWGGLGKAFDEGTFTGDGTAQRLRKLLGDEAYEQALLSRYSGFYTPVRIIDSLWDIARALGFKGGNVLEGSAGIGKIIGNMPKDLSGRSNISAVEIDSTTGGILSLLYPDAKVFIQGFEKTKIPNGSVDLSITNVPFVADLRFKDTSGDKDLSNRFRLIQDFCIAKNVRKLREGGIGIFITSSSTLDNSQKLLDWVVGEGGADFIGAFRLNNDTFGGTGTTSDILVVRKRVNGRKSPHAIDVNGVTGVRVGEYDDPRSKKKVQVAMDYNKYFVEHPEMMGGEMGFGYEHGDTGYRPGSRNLYPSKRISQDERLDAFVRSMEGKMEEPSAVSVTDNTKPVEPESKVYESLGEGVREGSMLIDMDGNLCIASYGQAVPLNVNKNKVRGHSKQECFRAYSAIKDAVKAVLDYETTHADDSGLSSLLKNLNKAFDDFVNTYGHFHKNPAISFLKNDMDYSSIAALETAKEYNDASGKRQVSYTKGDIFGRRVVEKESEPHPETVQDGVLASIYKHGRIDIPYIAEQLGLDAGEVKREIIGSGLGFENPLSREVEVSYEYLSGNVREKLHQAEESNENGEYDVNIKALRGVIPMDIPAHLIEFTLGSSWLEPKLYEDYVSERTGISVSMRNIGGTWVVKAPDWGLNNERNRTFGVRSEKFGKVIWGHELIIAALQNKSVRVTRVVKKWDGTKETEVDQEATQACSSKIDEIRQDFKDWARDKMQGDPEMSERAEREYNERFNNYVPKTIPDSFVPSHFGGASHAVTLRPHQAKAAIRATTQNVMLAHEVGTGKTFTLITTAMEMRRLGTARKPMIVVQNATVGQFVSSAKFLYPNAKILTLEDADRNAEGRKAFYAKIKYNDWDMIVIPQSAFDMIPDSPEREMSFVKDKIAEKMHVLEQMREADAENGELSRAENEIMKLQDELAQISGRAVDKRRARDEKRDALAKQNAGVKAREMLDRRVDDVEDFDEMGIDAILVDEAHEYKHLGFATAMQRGVKGIDPSYSKKSQGAYLKCKSVMERTGGKNVVFATGTPISNTAAEIWTFMRYLMPDDVMKEYGIYYFDDFVRNFGNLSQMLEFTTSGKFKENNRFAGYVNLPELVRIWSGVSDTVLTDEASDLKSKIPEMEGGKATDIYMPQTPGLRSVMRYVKAQLKEFDKMSGKEKKQNSHIPLTMYGIASAAAIDVRLVVDDAEDDPNSKTNEAVRQTLKTLEETSSYKGTVAIFADKFQNNRSGFNLYEDIRSKLIASGVPAEQIVVMKSGMSINKKLDIFDKVNSGDIRVIMGSTATLGTGVNIQERLHTLIHLDAPNRPMDYTQRNGRILRQGNIHRSMGVPVRILRFGVEDSLDVTAYQRLKTKGAIADSIMHGKQMMQDSMENRTMEEEEDVFGDTVAQLSGSEYALLKQQAEREVKKLESKERQHNADQTYIHNRIPQLESQNRAYEQIIENSKRGLALIEERGKTSDGSITIGTKHFTDVNSMGEFFTDYNKKINEESDRIRNSYMNEQAKRELTVNVGGFNFTFRTILSKETDRGPGGVLKTVVRRKTTYSCDELGLKDVPVQQGLLRNGMNDIVENVLTGNDFRERIEAVGDGIAKANEQLASMRSREGKPFEQAAELNDARKRLEEYEELMRAELEAKDAKYADMDTEVGEASGVHLGDEDDADDLHFSDGDDWEDGEDVEAINQQFNDDLEKYERGALPSGFRFEMGHPSVYLQSAGFDYLPISMRASLLSRKAGDDYHPFDASDLKDLVNAIQKPIAILHYTKDNILNLIVDVLHNSKHFLIGVTLNYKANGIEINSVSGLFPKDSHEWIKWIQDGKAIRIDQKEKVLDLINSLRTNPAESVRIGLDLSRAAKIVKEFENPKLPGENLSDDMHFSTSDELFSRYPGWLEGQTRDDGRHSTQIPSTVNSYRHIGDWMLRNGMGGVSVLDASSGLGNGTKALREMGFDVDDVEPYPSENRDAPTYLSYDDIDRKYDVVISNAVLNVIPDDWRRNVLHLMASKVKDGGRMIINVRDAGSISKQKQKIELDSPSEILVTDKKGNITAYQRGFTPKELREYVSSELGEGWDVVVANQGNSGLGSGTAVVATRNGGSVVEDSRDDVRSAIEETASTFGEDVEIVDDVSTLTHKNKQLEARMRKAKGMFNARTGKVTLVLPNLRTAEDAVGTVLHEVVGHKGLRELFGDDFDVFLDNVYNNVEDDIRERIDGLNKKKETEKDRRDATEEYLSRLTEGKEYEELVKRGVWQKIKDWFMDLLRKAGVKLKRQLNDNDLRYILWRSHERMKERAARKSSKMGADPLTEARDAAMRDELGIDKERQEGEKHFSDGEDVEGVAEDADYDAAREELNVYDAGRMTFEDAITDGLTKLAAKNKEDKKLRVEAVMAIGGNLSKILQGMSKQREYDRQTVDDIVRLARTVIANGIFRNFTPYQVGRLLGMVKRATGREDITKEADKVVDLLMDCQLKELESLFDRQLRTKGKKTDDRGVEIQGALDVEGQRMLDAMRTAIRIATKKGETELDDRMSDCLDRMGSDDDVTRQNAGQEYAGLLLAKEYMDNIAKSEAEEDSLYDEIRQADDERRQRKASGDSQADKDFREFKRETEAAIRENRLERMGAYGELITKLGGKLGESAQRAQDWLEQDKERAREIQHNANSDLEGVSASEFSRETWKQRAANWAPVRFFMKPLGTFDMMLRFFGSKSVDGRGYLWNRFMTGWVEANDKEWRNLRAAHDRLDEKVSEVFGRKMRWSDLLSMERKMDGVEVEFWDAGEKKKHTLTQGNMLYIYAVNKMSDGRMKLRKMGITEEDVERITAKIDPRFIALADWVQDEFLKAKRKDYNAVHLRLTGADMADIDNYFPLKVNKRSLSKEEEIGDGMEGEKKPATKSVSWIKRTRNSKPLDIVNADFFDVLLEHLQDNEHIAAFGELNRDINTLLSYKRFRNKVLNMSSLRYGSGKNLWNNFRRVCEIAGGVYTPKVDRDSVDTTVVNIAKGVTMGKISFRLYTAFKQLTSSPAFATEASPIAVAKNNPFTGGWQAWKWAIENLPGFSKRWQSRQAGDSRLVDTDSDWKFWHRKFVKTMSRWGMTPNALIDALTVACGAKAIYETKYKKYKKMGYPDAKAHRLALRDASVSVNETQQSSEEAYLSAMQLDRTAASTALTVFRNASMGYERRYADAMSNFVRKLKPGYKDMSIAFMKKQLMRDGLSEDDADKAANQAYRRSWWKDVANMAMFGHIMQIAWNLAPYLPFLFLIGGDDDKKKEMAEDALMHSLAGPIEGLSLGAQGSELLNMGRHILDDDENVWKATKKQLKNYQFNLLPLMSDVQSMFRHFASDQVQGFNDVINLIVQSGIGVNPQTITDMAAAIFDRCDGDPDLSREATIMWLRIANAPQTQLDQIYLEELGLKGSDAKKLSAGELADRYVRYKTKRETPLTGWMRSDEAKQNAEDRYMKKFLELMDERIGGLDDKEMQRAFDEGDALLRKEVGKAAAKKMGADKDEYGNPTTVYGEIYKQHRNYFDLSEDVLLQTEAKKAKDSGDMDRYKEIDSGRSAITKIKKDLDGAPYTLLDGSVITVDDIMNEIREERMKLLEELGL